MKRFVPIMPDEYKGNSSTAQHKDFVLKTRRWTKEEEAWAWDLCKEGYTIKEIAYSLDREHNSVSIKMKRLKKKHNEYNDKHRDDKYKYNLKYMKLFREDVSILDVFCGVDMFYNSHGYLNVVTNDKNTSIKSMYNLDADKMLDLAIEEGWKFDIVDLDPFGASISYLEKALKIAEYGLVMTLGELGHKRFKRLDFIGKYYSNITSVDDITIENMVEEIIRIASSKGIKLEVAYCRDWSNIGRVWFKIKR